MEIAKLKKRNHYEEITEQLKAFIADGQLKPGDKLPSTKELSDRFGVGRSTMREALSALKAMGLIEIRQGGGCRVLDAAESAYAPPELQTLRMNRDTLLHLMEARQSLEVSHAQVAAEKRTDEDIARMKRIVEEMEGALGNDEEGERTDVEFHASLAAMTHNPILISLFESIIGQLELSIREVRRVELYANRLVAERLLKEHKAIFRAVTAGDGDEAARQMRRHLRHVESILMKYL